jgi:hypothetical protein
MDSKLAKQKLWDLRITKTELAGEMGITLSTLWRFLSGKTQHPSKPFLTALEVAFKNIEARISAERINKTTACVKCSSAPLP